MAWAMQHAQVKQRVIVMAVHGNRIWTRAGNRWAVGMYKDQRDTDFHAAEITKKRSAEQYLIVAGPVVFKWTKSPTDDAIHAAILKALDLGSVLGHDWESGSS